MVVHPEVGYRNGVVLHYGFPASEPITRDIQTLFDKIFGVPFQAHHGEWFSRLIKSKELLHYYSMNTSTIKDTSILFQMDASIGTLLPSCLPYKLTRYAAQAVERTNGIYDTIAYASHD